MTDAQRIAELEKRVAELEAGLRPFGEAWSVAVRHIDVVTHLSMAQLGELVAHEVSGVHFRNARALLNKDKSHD